MKYGERLFVKDVNREFPNQEWEFELISDCCGISARSGPLTIECDGTLPEIFGVFVELGGIPLDFRAQSVAEARLKLVEFASGLTGLLETKEVSE